MASNDRDEIKVLLLGNMDSVARHFAPDGYRSGRYWMAKCPWRADRSGGSFWITVSGGYAGAWKDAATDEKGDVFALIDKAIGLNGDFRAVMQWARCWLGIGDMPAGEREARAAKLQAARQHAEADEAKQMEKNRRRAKAIFLEARKSQFVGSVADVYLQSRGIDVTQLGRMPGALGFLPAARHHETNAEWPCLVALMTAHDGSVAAVHRTFLDRDGAGKAPVRPARKIWPSFAGAAIRIWRGESRMDIKDAAAQGLRETLILCEGVEDGLSLALAMPQHRIWCAGSLGNLAKITLPECVDDCVVVADNDWGKPQAERQFDKALDALMRQDRTVRVARSHVGKDVNDALVS